MIIAGFIVGCLTLVSAMLFYLRKANRLVYKETHPARNTFQNLSAIPYKIEKFSFYSKDKVRLSAIIYRPFIPPIGNIVALHYLGGSKTSIYHYCRPLLEKGFLVASFDYVNHGESGSRKGNVYSLDDDVGRFLSELELRNIDGPYGFYGLSMGASAALSAVDHTGRILGFVLDSGPLIEVKKYFLYVLAIRNEKNWIIQKLFLFLFLYMVGFHKLSKATIRRIQQLGQTPIMMIHSRTDKVIPYKDALTAYEYAKKSNPNARLITIDKAHHLTGKIILGEQYDRLLTDFFLEALTENE